MWKTYFQFNFDCNFSSYRNFFTYRVYIFDKVIVLFWISQVEWYLSYRPKTRWMFWTFKKESINMRRNVEVKVRMYIERKSPLFREDSTVNKSIDIERNHTHSTLAIIERNHTHFDDIERNHTLAISITLMSKTMHYLIIYMNNNELSTWASANTCMFKSVWVWVSFKQVREFIVHDFFFLRSRNIPSVCDICYHTQRRYFPRLYLSRINTISINHVYVAISLSIL